MGNNRIILPILPRPWVHFNSGKNGDHVFFAIPEDCRKKHQVTGKKEDEGLPCDDYVAGNIYCGHTLSESGRSRKRRIERYNKYRIDLFHLAKMANFQLPTCGWSIYFYFPMPIRWSKKKKAIMHGQLKLSQPDESNCLAAFEDALVGRDEELAQMSGLGKFWFDQTLVEETLRQGYIEILINQPVYNPFNVVLVDQHKSLTMEDLEVRRKQRAERNNEIRAKKKENKKNAEPPKAKKVRRIMDKSLFKKEDKLK